MCRIHSRFMSDAVRDEDEDNQSKVPEETPETDPQFATEEPAVSKAADDATETGVEDEAEVKTSEDADQDDSKPGRVKQWITNLVSGESGSEEAAEEENDAILAEKYKTALQQSQADFFNARERHKKELSQEREYAMKKFAHDMLQVVDAVETALTQGRDSKAEDAQDRVNGLFEGVELIQKQLLQVFERHGVEKIECLGEEFDPNLHEAVVTMPSDAHPPDHVVQIVRDGFLIKNQVLRAPMVGVSIAPPSPPPSSNESEEK